MEALTHFRTIDELVRMFDRERSLLRDMFEKRKSLNYRNDFAMVQVDYKLERIKYLIDHGVIHENGDFLELEDIYLQFFEDVLDMNEVISVASVKEYIDSLLENINYSLKETNEQRKILYQGSVRKILRKIGLRTLKNVIDLKRNVEVAYKQEPNYRIKIEKLKNLDEKRTAIASMIQECERVMSNQMVFFQINSDPQMLQTCQDVRNDFTEAFHNLYEIERQIIDFINRIEQQSLLLKKIRKIKYLKDQLTWSEDTNVIQQLNDHNPLWMESRPYSKIFLSLEMLRSSEEMYALIRKVGQKKEVRSLARTESPALSEEELQASVEEVDTINTTEIWNAFSAQGNHLFYFIRQYRFRKELTLREMIVLFCQMAVQYADDLTFTDTYEQYDLVEYPLVYVRQSKAI